MDYCHFIGFFVLVFPKVLFLELRCGGTLSISWKFVCRALRLIKKKISRTPVFLLFPQWLHQMKVLLFHFYHSFFDLMFSTSRSRSSLNKWPRILGMCWNIYWIFSRRAFSKIIVNSIVNCLSTGQSTPRSSWTEGNCKLLPEFLELVAPLKEKHQFKPPPLTFTFD